MTDTTDPFEQLAALGETDLTPQRIAEEQLRRELREWRSEEDRRWATATLAQSKSMEEQAKRDQARDAHLQDLDARHAQGAHELTMLRDALAEARVAVNAQLRMVREGLMRHLALERETIERSLTELTAAFKLEED